MFYIGQLGTSTGPEDVRIRIANERMRLDTGTRSFLHRSYGVRPQLSYKNSLLPLLITPVVAHAGC